MGERTSMFTIYPYLSANEAVSFPYYLIGPETVAPDKKYPLIVVLHGRSGHAYGAWFLANEIKNKGMETFVVVPVMKESVDDWLGKKFEREDAKNPRPIDHVALMTKKIMTDFPVDPARVYVTGYSMGGVGTFGILAAYPDIFAAGVPICGASDLKAAKILATKPIWAFHGGADETMPAQLSRNIVQAIEKAGGAPKYTEYPNVGHNSWIQAYHETNLFPWLFSQSKK